MASQVLIKDLNDYIAPAQACVVALKRDAQQSNTAAEQPQESSFVLLQPREPLPPPSWQVPNGPKEGELVRITLHDCLACSGCITTAETMLLEQQSLQEFSAALSKQGTYVVVSVSSQSIAALAAVYQLAPLDAWQRLVAWLRSLGAHYVADLVTARDVSLLENAAEFIARYRVLHGQQLHSSQHSHPPAQLSALQGLLAHTSEHEDSVSGMDIDEDTAAAPAAPQGMVSIQHGNGLQGQQEPLPLPILASTCPGWAVYAEKTQGSAIIPHMSSAKSPQAVMGSMVKRLLSRQLGCAPSQIFHATVMPCYDKKLEAARDELMVPGTKVPEVDCCLTSVELHQLLTQQGITSLAQVPLSLGTPSATPGPTPITLPGQQYSTSQGQDTSMDMGDAGQQGFTNAGQQGFINADQQGLINVLPDSVQPASHPQPQQGQVAARGPAQLRVWQQGLPSSLFGLAGGSGGYMDFVFRVAAAELFGIPIPSGPLPMKQLRNADFQEVEVSGPNGEVLLRGAIVNGFRNIQTLMRQIKSKRCTYHYVEVMACPSGCLNGGGQLKPGAGQSAAQVLEAVEAAYHHAQVIPRQPVENTDILALYQHWVGGLPGSQAAKLLLHTEFKPRNSVTAAGPRLATDW